MSNVPTYTYQDWHPTVMPLLWILTIDVSIFFALYKHKRYAFYVHAFMGVCIWSIGLGFCIPYINDTTLDDPDPNVDAHKKIGLAVIVIVSAALLLGVLGRLLQMLTECSSLLILIIKKAHAILGYSVTFLAKANFFFIMYINNITIFVLLLGWECFFVGFLLMRKYTYPSLQQTIVPIRDYHQDMKTPSIQSISQIPDSFTDFVIFANRVYSIEPLKTEHPAGIQIINSVRGRQIDRFIYGMYKSEGLPLVPTHSHSSRAFDLLGAPIAKIDIRSTYPTLFHESKIFVADDIRMISEKGQIYKISLKPKFQKSFPYLGYSNINQIGRYYTLTLNKNVTRLYTMVNFLHRKNVQLLKKAIPDALNEDPQTFETMLGLQSADRMNQNFEEDNCLPLMIKKYETGVLTPMIVDESEDKQKIIELSAPQGQGLHFSTLQPGKIIIVAGGTGHFPFCDLFDLLFKSTILTTKSLLAKHILQNDPILSENPFQKFIFTIMISLNHIEDMHPVTLKQLLFLAKHKKQFNVTLRIKENDPLLVSSHPEINFTQTYFEKMLIDEMIKEECSHIFVCGPPMMNESMLALLKRRGAHKYTLL